MAFTSTRGSITPTRGTIHAYPATAAGVDWRTAPGVEVHLQTTTATAAFLGGTGVTSATGYSLGPGSAITVNVDPGETLCAVSAAGGTAVVHILKSTRD